MLLAVYGEGRQDRHWVLLLVQAWHGDVQYAFTVNWPDAMELAPCTIVSVMVSLAAKYIVLTIREMLMLKLLVRLPMVMVEAVEAQLPRLVLQPKH